MASVCCSCKENLTTQHCDYCYNKFSEEGDSRLSIDLQCTCVGVRGILCQEWYKTCTCNIPLSNQCNCCGGNCCLNCSFSPGELCDCCAWSTLICNRCLESCIQSNQIQPEYCMFKKNYCWSCYAVVGGKEGKICFKVESGSLYCLKCFSSPYTKPPTKKGLRKTISC